MLNLTNGGFGLLRVLAPDIFGFILATFFFFTLAYLALRLTTAAAVQDGAKHEDVVKAKRTVRTGFRWVWYVVAFAFAWHALTVTWSLRIPRSDVDATGVYQQMDSLTK